MSERGLDTPSLVPPEGYSTSEAPAGRVGDEASAGRVASASERIGTTPADRILLGFTHALRAAGVAVTSDRSQSYLEAVSLVGLDDRRATYTAGRATLCGGPDDLARYDQVFEAYFGARDGLPMPRPARSTVQSVGDLPLADGVGAADRADDVTRAMASEVEVLRHRDVAGLTAAEKQRLAALFNTLTPRAPQRRTARHRPWHRGRVDAARTLRTSLRRMGEPAEIAWRRRATKPRRVVLLIDVSGSMSGYADTLLRLAHRMSTSSIGGRTGSTGGRPVVETFTVGTRLTHLTRALRVRDSERALVAAGDTVPDWSGGTRLGETLQVFLERWGRRGMARGAVVVVFSDGWERGDVTLLAEQARQLSRVAHRLVWVNPHRGKDGYEPIQAGVLAVLPHVDHFVAGHSLATYQRLLEVVADA
ncbi:VWA domain-containing protein [Nocardioides sp. CER19]|uniref:vWA domain-containing protein n=1 Tax=Nocardioides sp. CER19 TaxID=3038538 RepID=UPI00244A1B44|nr:VWA domain-containing protein [Nocardioides sp. CER19]MDH2413450.1 VWA domain-containing protein [Nocardioides sp. CER19]